MPVTGLRSTGDGPLVRPAGRAQGAGRRDPVRDLPRARLVDDRARRRRSSPTGSGCTPTPCASTSSACARSASSTSRPCTAARSGVRSTSTSSPTARPVSGSTRRRTRCSPASSRPSPSGSVPTPTTPPTPATRGASRSAAAPGRRAACKALEGELARLGFEPVDRHRRRRRTRARARIEFLHCPFRELAEAYPELVCNLHRGLCEGVVDQVGGGRVDDFATLYDPEPCHVTGRGRVP